MRKAPRSSVTATNVLPVASSSAVMVTPGRTAGGVGYGAREHRFLCVAGGGENEERRRQEKPPSDSRDHVASFLEWTTPQRRQVYSRQLLPAAQR